jgi:putative thioredoxin
VNADIVDVSEKDFESSVLKASETRPVVVDFWAPWCGPCRVLGPLLEKIAGENGGRLVLAKVNVDQNPGLADSFGIRGIPAVKAFRHGEIVDEFSGALPESEVRSFFSALLPTEADEATERGTKLEQEGKFEEAEKAYRSALSMDPRHARALVSLARILEARNEADEALRLAESVTGEPEETEANRIAARLRLRRGVHKDEEENFRKRVQSDPSDLEARLGLARLLAARERYEEALEELLQILKQNRSFRDGEPRKTMLEIFEVVGPRSPLAEKYRTEMAKLIFS